MKKSVCLLIGDAVGSPMFIIRYTTLRGSRSWSKHIRPAVVRLVRREGKKPKSNGFFLDSPMLYNESEKRWFNSDEAWEWFQERRQNKEFRKFEFNNLTGDFEEFVDSGYCTQN